MVDPESVRRRLREIDRRLTALREIETDGRDAFLRDAGLQAQAERHLQLALQAALDVTLHVVAEESGATPEDYASSFTALADLGIVESDLAGRLRLAAGLRNILVHAYLDVDPERVWTYLSRLEDLERFASAISAYLTR